LALSLATTYRVYGSAIARFARIGVTSSAALCSAVASARVGRGYLGERRGRAEQAVRGQALGD
jgi:hypothetical protein